MNSNRGIGVMMFESGKEPYTAVLEDSLKHQQALVGGGTECIPLPHEAVLCCDAGGRWVGLPVNRQFGSDVIHGTFFLYDGTPEGHGLSLTEDQTVYFQHYFTGPQPSAVTFEVQSAKDMEEFLRLIFGDRRDDGSK